MNINCITIIFYYTDPNTNVAVGAKFTAPTNGTYKHVCDIKFAVWNTLLGFKKFGLKKRSVFFSLTKKGGLNEKSVKISVGGQK